MHGEATIVVEYQARPIVLDLLGYEKAVEPYGNRKVEMERMQQLIRGPVLPPDFSLYLCCKGTSTTTTWMVEFLLASIGFQDFPENWVILMSESISHRITIASTAPGRHERWPEIVVSAKIEEMILTGDSTFMDGEDANSFLWCLRDLLCLMGDYGCRTLDIRD